MTRYACAALAALMLAAGCTTETPEVREAEPKVEGTTIVYPESGKPPAFAVATVTFDPAPGIQLNGRLTWDEDRTVRVYTPLGGRVARILVQPGDSVRQGQVLAVLASPEFGQAQAEARRADADLALADKNLQRQRELESHGVAPRKDLQSAEAEFARAQAELERARVRLKLYGASGGSIDQTFALTSPIAGVVVEKNINPGQEVRPDQMTSNAPPLFIVTDPRYLWAILDAAEKELPHLEIGKSITLHTPVYRDAEFSARIAGVSDFLDPATRALKVRAKLDNGQRRLKAEMFVTGKIAVKHELSIQLPAKAVFFQAGKHYVFTEDAPGRYTRREVTPSEEQHGRVGILRGLEEGQRVVTDSVLMLQQMLQPRRIQK